jgi:hypothetical protein
MAKSDPAFQAQALCGAYLGQPTENYVGPNNFWNNDVVSHGFKSALDKACEAWRNVAARIAGCPASSPLEELRLTWVERVSEPD